jgi:hypothetical protein
MIPVIEEPDSSGGVATGWMTEESEFDSRESQEIFLFSRTSRQAYPASYTMGNRGCFSGGKAAGA